MAAQPESWPAEHGKPRFFAGFYPSILPRLVCQLQGVGGMVWRESAAWHQRQPRLFSQPFGLLKRRCERSALPSRADLFIFRRFLAGRAMPCALSGRGSTNGSPAASSSIFNSSAHLVRIWRTASSRSASGPFRVAFRAPPLVGLIQLNRRKNCLSSRSIPSIVLVETRA